MRRLPLLNLVLRAPLLALLLLAGQACAQEVRVGLYQNEPKLFTNDAGEADGILIDLLQEVAARENWQLKFVACEWQECLKALEAGAIDLMPDVAYTAERERQFDFHQTPALYSWSQLYCPQALHLKSPLDLAGKKLVVLEGSVQQDAVKTLLEAFGLKASITAAPSMDEVFLRVQQGDADAAAAGHYFGDIRAHEYGLVETPVVFNPARLFYATAQGRNPDLLAAIDRHLELWLQDSSSPYFSIIKNWGGDLRHQEVPSRIWNVLAIITLALLALTVLALFLRWQVQSRTRQLAENNAKLQRMSKLYNALSQCNQAIVRCGDEAELFPKICRDAVHFGGMRMAWIGSLDEASGKVAPVASFGAGVEYLDGIDISIRADEPAGRGPSGIALRENHPVWCQDFQHDETTAPWHQRGAAYGWAASAALPLHRKGKVVGVLTLYADTAGAFDVPVQNLLAEMAMDIDYALDRFEDATLRQQADLKITRQAEKLASLLQVSRELAGNIDLQAVLQTATARIAHLSSLKSSALYLLQDAEHLYLGATSPPLPPDFSHHLRLIPLADHPHIRRALEARELLLLADAASATLTEAEAEVTRLLGLRTILYLPLLADNEVLGVLIVASTEQAVSLTEGEMELCRTLANLAAVAVKNAQLFEAVEHSRADLQANFEALKQAKAELRESQALNLMAGELAHFGGWAIELPQMRVLWSDVTCDIHEMPRGTQPTLEQGVQFYAPEHLPRIRDMIGKVISAGIPFDGKLQIITAGGKRVWVRALGRAVRDAQGVITRVEGAFQDISSLKQLEDSMLKLSLAVEQSPSSIVITDLDANIVYANATFTRITGYALGDVLGRNPRILHSGKTPKATYDDMWSHLTRGERWEGEFINRRRDGSEYTEWARLSPVRDEQGGVTSYLAIKDDITAKKQAEARIEHLAHFDQLTGLPNRTLLQDHFRYALSLAQRNQQQLAVMFLDLDHFKVINDTLGHSIGDQLLMEVGRRLKEAVREEDTVSRLGGDEFILLLPGVDANGAAKVARKLIEAVALPYQYEVHELIATPSIGIALYPNDGEDMETLSKHADAAMYQAKQAGRNDFRFFTPAMQHDSVRHLRLATDLRHALGRNELILNYQPQIAMQNGRVIGAEALLRWQHPELGLISPAEFIPIAENSGLIIAIGEWVLRTAAAQAKAWLDTGQTEFVMAVNLSAVQFRHPELLQRVTAILIETGLPAQALELELTEAVAMDDPQAAVAVMDRLHEHGIRMSIDDFGTGYSSLSYLKRFKVYKLKIDQSFVRDIGSDPEDKAIVTAIINMASSLGMHTIAEGVETAEQLAFLRLHGCDEVQGYYFSKPLTAEAFGEFLRR